MEDARGNLKLMTETGVHRNSEISESPLSVYMAPEPVVCCGLGTSQTVIQLFTPQVRIVFQIMKPPVTTFPIDYRFLSPDTY